VADQVGEQAHGVVAEGLDGLGVGGGGRFGDGVADAVGDLGVLAPEPGHPVGQAGGVLEDLLVEAAGGLGDLDVDREHLLELLQDRAEAGAQAVLAAQAVGVVGGGQGLLEPGDGPPQAEPLSLGRLQRAGGRLVCLADLTLLHGHRSVAETGPLVTVELWY
jgi:hypothetical protein